MPGWGTAVSHGRSRLALRRIRAMGTVQPRLEPVTAPGVPAACVTAFGAVPVVPQKPGEAL